MKTNKDLIAKTRRIPLSVPSLKGNEMKYAAECIETEWVSSAGKYVERFERDIADYLGAKNAVAVSSGTAALHLALICAGVKRDEEVFVPSVTFIAPVNAVNYVGAHPVFVDCDRFLNMSAGSIGRFIEKNCSVKNKKLVNTKTGRKISAVIPVHIFGHPADMAAIMEIAAEYGLKVIEDATESLGSSYTGGPFAGAKTGTIGDFGCFSFNGNKIITTGGGGMLVCRRDEDSRKARYLSTQAKDDAAMYIHNSVGFNYRLTNIQAAIGCAQLEKIDSYISIKRSNFELYRRLLAGVGGVEFITEPEYSKSNYWFYSLVADPKAAARDALIEGLKRRGIEARPLWFLNHLQRPYAKEPRAPMKLAPYYYERVVNLPCGVGLSERDVAAVCRAVRNEVEKNADM